MSIQVHTPKSPAPAVALAERAPIAAGHPAHHPTHVPTQVQTQVLGVLIVDDHPLVRKGILLALRSHPEFTVIGEAGSGDDALRLLERVDPQIILLDLVMPGMEGIATIRALHARAPEAKILVLTSYEESNLVQDALQAGATGFQGKGGTIADLIQSIRSVAVGKTTLDAGAAQVLVQATQRGHALGDDLTQRERDVLGLLALGLPNAAIAEQLMIAQATVKFHVRGIRSKLRTSNRTETAAVAIRNHLVLLN
jgi:two-component system, NarL family, response regulator LiaR